MDQRTLITSLVILVVVVAALGILFFPEAEPDVVLYCSVDLDQSRPMAEQFEKEADLHVHFQGEVESQRSIGLARRLSEEAKHPRADVFWANEIMNTVWLGQAGVLDALPPGVAEQFPAAWRDPEGRYVAFGARARIFLVNTALLPDEKDHPRALADLVDPKYAAMGFTTSMAAPLTGTTYAHAVALLTTDEAAAKAFLESVAKAATEGRVKIVPSNGTVMNVVKNQGEKVAFGLTDTDDAWQAIREGAPVKVIYPDQAEGRPGTLLIPNTVSLVKGRPHPDAAEKLLRWIASADVERRLAEGPTAQIPVRDEVPVPADGHVRRPGKDFRAAVVDWQAVGRNRDRWLDFLNALFRTPR
jgi:iron(III) transport system substrate-binding protein